jgi:endonuclease/exonuclease/phosphatase family metal-dependent hydrolase
MKFYSFLAISLSLVLSSCNTNAQSTTPETYKLVVYNVENLFDADGIAVFSDYQPDMYTPRHVFTKIDNMTRLMAKYNNGSGPDILVLSEMESDHSQPEGGNEYNTSQFLKKYANTTLEKMLGDDFNEEIADLPSELLLLKGFYDRNLRGYDISVAYDPLENGRPTHVQKNVIFSRLPILHEKTRMHSVLDARPILETWIDVEGYPLIVFANHWKSRASDAEIEKIRVQNAQVLRARLDELRSENNRVDFVLGGDFNSDYNQSYRYQYMEITGVNDVLMSTGNETAVANGHPEKVYNLYHEIPVDQRGSDTFRGYWGTLMQIMISPGLYDYYGVQYVDNSFEVGIWPGKNVYETSGAPNRWSAFGDGHGYSDHLPISMRFRVVRDDDTSRVKTLLDPGYTDNELWSPIAVTNRLPNAGEYIDVTTVSGSLRTSAYFDKLFLVEATPDSRGRVTVNGEIYDTYSPVFDTRVKLGQRSEDVVQFYGRLGLFRGNWQFVIESDEYILN